MKRYYCNSCEEFIPKTKKFAKIETGKRSYIFCERCLLQAYQTLAKEKLKTKEAEAFFKKIVKWLKKNNLLVLS